jgi:predicted small metal-binding protein
MLRVSCADMGAPCAWEAAAETADELRRKIWAHAESDHKDMLEGMDEEAMAELEARIDLVIESQEA